MADKPQTALILGTILLLAACQKSDCNATIDLTKQHQYFVECMAAQKQPEQNHEDDNGDYVKACLQASRAMAWSVIGKDCEREEKP